MKKSQLRAIARQVISYASDRATGLDERVIARALRKGQEITFGWREPAESIDDRPFSVWMAQVNEGDTLDGVHFDAPGHAAMIGWPGEYDPRPGSTTYYAGYSRLF